MRDDSGPVILITAKLGEEQEARIRAAAPGARIVREPDIDAEPDLVRRIEICYPRLPSALWKNAVKLAWLQSSFAGMDSLLALPAAREHPALFTNVHIHAHCIAEHLWGMALMLTRNLHKSLRAQESGTWETALVSEGVETLAGRTLCIAGLGVIGAHCAALGRAFGMRVIGISRSGRQANAVDEMAGPDKRRDVFARSQVIMLILPDTPETKGFVGKAELDVMKGVCLLNAGRGGSIVTNQLVKALQDGRVRAAGLDVTDPEPLPSGHPLWNMPNVIITPHYGGVHPGYDEEALSVFCSNLERWVRGQPLQNVVDKTAGY
jgi:phosphoglycerate dehydrogenase-like enzyme